MFATATRPQPAAQVFASLKRSLATIEREHKNSVLYFADILQRKLYRELGYSSIWHLAQQGLGFSKTRAAQYIRLAKAVDGLPRLKRAVASGEVEWTKARELTRIATPKNEAAWVARAKKRSRRQLQADVRAAQARPITQKLLLDTEHELPPGDLPVRVGFDLTPEQLARYEKLMEVLRKQGRGGSPAEVLLEALASLADQECTRVHPGSGRSVPARPAYQVVVHRCDRCRQAEMPTTRGAKKLDAATAAAVGCDHDLVTPDGANRSEIPPKLRRKVLARDRHRCSTPGCTHARFLQIHHRIKREDGGPNTLENLVTLCSACHRIQHRNE